MILAKGHVASGHNVFQPEFRIMSKMSLPMHNIPWTPAAKGESSYEPTPEGTYAGWLCRVQYFGTHIAEDQKTKKPYDVHKIALAFEIDYREEGQEKNRIISTGYPMTYSLGAKSNLRKLMKPWLGSRFPEPDDPNGLDWEMMMDLPVMVSVEHETRKNKEGIEKTYDRISGLSMPPKGMPPLQATQDQYSWSITSDLDMKLAEELKMPNFLIEFAKQSKEYKEALRQREGKALDDKVMDLVVNGGAKKVAYSNEIPVDDNGEPVF